jgi:hypothetical protein
MDAMSPDELVLAMQRLVDRVIRRLRLGSPPEPTVRRRFLIIQIDGLSREVLEHAVGAGRMPFLARLLARHTVRLTPMTVGMPTSTPAFQLALMYGVRPDIPGFHYHDKRRGADIYFPRAGDAAFVEASQAGGCRGIVEGGSTYGCVFTGGAVNNLFSFAVLKRPTGAGILRAGSALVVLTWVLIKGFTLTVIELVRAVLRLAADPVGESRRGWKWLAIKVGLSVWVRQLFTLAVARDLYAGVPAIYVNYLDYDVFSHAYGPHSRRAVRALRRIDASIRQLWGVVRRVPGHRYDLYVLSDHGQAATVPYQKLSGGAPIERVFFEQILPAAGGPAGEPPAAGAPRGVASAIRGFRQREPGVFQRFVNYLERDFPWVLGEVPEARQSHGVRVIAAGSNAFVYFTESVEPLTLARIDQQFPGLVDELSRTRGVGFVLARSEAGPVCGWRGKRYVLNGDAVGPFAGRPDWPLTAEGLRDLMAMPSAGDLVIYGNGTPDGNVSYIPEAGAHAGPWPEELHCFIVSPAGVTLPAPLTHPTQLYPHFLQYQKG